MGTLRLCVVLNRSVFIPSTRKRSDTDLTEGCLCLRLSRYWPWPAQPLLRSTAFMSQPRTKPGSSSLTQPAVPRHFPCSEQPFLSLSLPTWSLPAPAQRAPTTTEMITNTTPRSNNNGFLDGLNIVSWISMLQDVYEKFDYNDLDCQKRLICEVMKEPGFYGAVAQKFKTGFQYAKYLEILDLPDD